jgi:hypothetical protein
VAGSARADVCGVVGGAGRCALNRAPVREGMPFDMPDTVTLKNFAGRKHKVMNA